MSRENSGISHFFSEYPLKCDNYATVSLCIYKVSGHGVVLMWF